MRIMVLDWRFVLLIAFFTLNGLGRVLSGKDVVLPSSTACDLERPCLNGGQCIPRQTIGQESTSNGGYICMCASGYSGQRCESKSSKRPCVTNNCLNGGSCFIEANRHQCVCPAGFRGQKCETIDSPGVKLTGCANGTCPFDSLCVSGRCECRTGYVGSPGRCRRIISSNGTDPCLQEPCRNGGTCYQNLTKSWCVCPKGFNGEFCELRRIRSTDICANVVCAPGQRCISGTGGIHKCVSVTPILHGPPLLADDATLAPIIVSQTEATAALTFPTVPPFPPPRDNNATSTSTCDVGAGTGTAAATSRQCLNDGRCLPNNQGGFSCLCTAGWTGPQCETAIVSCSNGQCTNNTCETVCQNGANCTTKPNGSGGYDFACHCQPGFTGSHCETNVDDCVGIQCPNGKVCVDAINTYECRCPPRFFGADCEFEAASSNECGSCKNGATCLRKRGDGGQHGNFTCVCRPGYTGRDCEREVDECELYSNPCLNGGTCFDGLVGFGCRCQPGFTGLRCDTRMSDACEKNPCPKDTVCTASAQDPKGYVCINTGPSSKPTACAEKPCQNGATCIDNDPDSTGNATGGFRCVCLPGFAGDLCESTVQEIDISKDEPQSKIDNCDDGSPNPCRNGGSCRMAAGKSTCSCPAGFSGALCEDDVDECEDDPCSKGKINGRFVCVNTIGSYRCECATGRGGDQCEVELAGCRSNPCTESNMVCKPTFAGGRHGHSCECAPGFHGSGCSEDSTVSFNGNSLIYHLSTSALSGSSQTNYSVKFRLRTTLTDVIVAEGVDITPSVIFSLVIRDGRLHLDWTSGEKISKSIGFRTRIDTGEWFGVELVESSAAVHTHLINTDGTLLEALPMAKNTRSGAPTMPVFTTKFGGLTSTASGKRYFVGCMQDMFVNGQRLLIADGEKTHTVVNVTRGCIRKRQCQEADGKEICGGPKRGRCVDMWSDYSCHCKRPYLAPDCSRAMKEATFGYEQNLSYVEILLDQADKKSVEMTLDLSMMVRTRSSDGLLAYLGSNLDFNNPNNAYQSFITLEISGGRLRSLVQLGTAKPQAFSDDGVRMKAARLRARSSDQKVRTKSLHVQSEGENITDEAVISDQTTMVSIAEQSTKSINDQPTRSNAAKRKYRRLDDGKVHIVRLLRRENEIKGYVDDVQVFEGRLGSPFPYPLLIDHFYIGGMPSGGVAVVTRQKRQVVIDTMIGRRPRQVDTHQISRQSFKGTMQDVRVNGAHVPLLKKQMQDLVGSTSSQMFGEPVPHNNVLEGTVSDDVCKWKPCQNSGACRVTFNDYECTCADGWWGKNCTLEDTCYQKKPCQPSFKCHNLQKSATENGYICTTAVTLNASSSAVFHIQKAPGEDEEDADNEEYPETMVDTVQFDIRTRSAAGVIFMMVREGEKKTEENRGSATTTMANVEHIMTTVPSLPEEVDTPLLAGNSSDIGDVRFKGRRTRTIARRPRLLGRKRRSVDTERDPRSAEKGTSSVFHPEEFLILELENGGLDLRYSIKRLNLDVHLKNISADLLINDGQWHSIKFGIGSNGIQVHVDEETRRVDGEDNEAKAMPLRSLLKGNPTVHVGSVPRQFSNLAESGGQSFKGCLQDVRIGKDGWLLFHQQSLSMEQLLAASQGGHLFAMSSSSSIRDDGCHGDDVCHNGNKDTCHNGASCEDQWNQHKCHCQFGYSGNFCETNIDDCVSNQCSNGATCVDGIGNYTCTCVHGFTGLHCETNIDDCAPDPCQNNGTCIDLVGGYECQCNANYTGAQCEIWILVDCASNPCQRGGKCFDMELPNGQKTFNCTCPPAYYGRACEKERNFCESSPCLNGANCTSHSDLLDYRCSCLHGFTGRNCEENVDECLQRPCLHGQCVDGWGNFTCECSAGWTGLLCDEDIDECEKTPCNSSGRTVCINSPGSFHCECPLFYFGENCEIEGECLKQPCIRGNCTQQSPTTPHHCECPHGFTGAACETEINFCESNPCANGATCQPFTGGFHCACVLGFTGTFCETNINECESNSCENSGTCIDGIGQYSCNCTGTGYQGSTCHEDLDECQIPSMCVHAIGCKNTIGSYNCSCQKDYMGPKCDVRNPCLSNTTHTCQNSGRCVNARVVMDKTAGAGGFRVTYDCDCVDGFHGDYCQIAKLADKAGLGGRLEYILGPVAGALGVVLIIAAVVLFVVVLRNKRATHGTYSPSRQEITGARMQMGAMMKPPPEERLI